MTAQGSAVQLDLGDSVEDLTRYLDVSQKSVKRAVGRAVRKLSAWLAREVKRDISAYLGVSQRLLANRFKVDVKASEGRASIWVGVRAIDPVQVGKLELDEDGSNGGVLAKLGSQSWFFEGGFAGRSRNGKQGIFKRKGRGRLPILRQRIDISKYAQESVKRVRNRAQARFYQLLEQELNFALNVENSKRS